MVKKISDIVSLSEDWDTTLEKVAYRNLEVLDLEPMTGQYGLAYIVTCKGKLVDNVKGDNTRVLMGGQVVVDTLDKVFHLAVTDESIYPFTMRINMQHGKNHDYWVITEPEDDESEAPF